MKPTDEQVEKAHKALMSELFMLCQPNRGDVFSFMDDQKEAVRAALTAAGVKPRVKPLVWTERSDIKGLHDTKGADGWYRNIRLFGGRFEYDSHPPQLFDTLDEAKAAAQADYEARILSALTTEGE